MADDGRAVSPGSGEDSRPAFEWVGREAAALLAAVPVLAKDVSLVLFFHFQRERLLEACPRARAAGVPEIVWCHSPGGCVPAAAFTWHRGRPSLEGAAICIAVCAQGRLIGVMRAAQSGVLAQDPAAASLRVVARALGRLWEVRWRPSVRGMRSPAGPRLEETQWLSMELHDGLAQTLTAALHRLQMYRDMTDSSYPQREELLPGAEALVRRGLAETRGLISRLRSPAAGGMRLGALLREEARRLELEMGCPVEYEEDAAREVVPSEVEVALYRVAREALTNVLKHAGARRVRVALRVEGGRVALAVRDWGRGFEVAGQQSTSSAGSGLTNMRRRVEALGGEFKVQSTVGKGTLVTASVPLRRQEADARQGEGAHR